MGGGGRSIDKSLFLILQFCLNRVGGKIPKQTKNILYVILA